MTADRAPSATAPRLGPILAIETATLQAGVALIDAHGRELASRRARVTTHSEQLLALVAAVLEEGGLSGRLSELGAIACGAGPGSFTGLRIGLATAKGLCLATGVPLVMISSLSALAVRVAAGPAGCIVVPCIDAFKAEVYAGFYARDANGDGDQIGALRMIAPESVLAPERLAEWMRERLGSPGAVPVHLVGDGAARWPVLEVDGLIAMDRAPPDPLDVARLAALRAQRGDFDDLDSAIPAYIRPSEAELKGPPPMPSRDLPAPGQSGGPTEEQIERLRQSGIRLDSEGRFIHEGQEVRHGGLRAALWRWLDRNPDGRYVLRLDQQRFVYLEVDDAPHLVRSLRWQGDQAELLLADGSGETLDPSSVHMAESGMAYCRVKSGRFEARLGSAAWTALGERIEERDGAAYLLSNGRPWPLAAWVK